MTVYRVLTCVSELASDGASIVFSVVISSLNDFSSFTGFSVAATSFSTILTSFRLDIRFKWFQLSLKWLFGSTFVLVSVQIVSRHS